MMTDTPRPPMTQSEPVRMPGCECPEPHYVDENPWLARLVNAEHENHCGDAACMTRRVSAAIRVLTGGKEHQDYCWAVETFEVELGRVSERLAVSVAARSDCPRPSRLPVTFPYRDTRAYRGGADVTETTEQRKERVRVWREEDRPCSRCGFARINVRHEPDPDNAPEGREFYDAIRDKMHSFVAASR